METLTSLFSAETLAMFQQWAITFCKNAVIAIIVFLIGKLLINWVVKLFGKVLSKRATDPGVESFLKSVVNVVLWLLLAIVIISILGIETSSFIALFASAGMAIGMALSGTLQNFAGGVMILLFKPFRVGDYIEAQGFQGTVKEIQIFNTILITVDNQTIIIPNGGLSTGAMKNLSKEPYRRVDLKFQFCYGTDFEDVRQAITELQKSTPEIIQQPIEGTPVAAPWLGLISLDESGVSVQTRQWVKSSDYWTVYFGFNETVYQQLKGKGFMFPFNRVDVTMLK